MADMSRSPVSMISGGVIPTYSVVAKKAGNVAVVCDGTTALKPYGIAVNNADASGQSVSVVPFGVGEWVKMPVIAAGQFAEGAPLYTAAGGQVDDSGSQAIPATADEAASGKGAVIAADLANIAESTTTTVLPTTTT